MLHIFLTVARRHSGSSVTTDTTESDADSVRGHQDRRTVVSPPVNVFGLTEVKVEESKSIMVCPCYIDKIVKVDKTLDKAIKFVKVI